MEVLYYYYYLFYSKILKDNEPHLLTILAFSASEGFAINGLLDIFFIKTYCFPIGKWAMIFIVLLFVLFNYIVFFKSGRSQKIVKLKPKIFGNHRLSILLTFVFFIVTISFIFWGPIFTSELLEKCR